MQSGANRAGVFGRLAACGTVTAIVAASALGQPAGEPPATAGGPLNPEREPTPLLDGAAPEAFGTQGTRWGFFGGGVGIDGEESTDLNGFAQMTWFIVDNVELGGELGAWNFKQSGPDAVGGSLTALLRWHFVNEGRLSLFVDGGIGVMAATDEVPEGGTDFNFMPRAGVGATWRPWDGPMRVLTGLRWHHISNARSSGAEDNPSRDGAMLYVGLGIEF